MKVVSFNVNGIRAAARRGVVDFLRMSGDIICLQEIKANAEQAMEVLRSLESEFHVFVNPAQKAGYSGTALVTRSQPISVRFDFGFLGDEGRVIIAEYAEFYVVNCYVPHGGKRLDVKMEFLDVLWKTVASLDKPVIVAGDMNIAHTEKDLSHPKICHNTTGFLPEERKVLDGVVGSGFVDTFRVMNPDVQAYTWDSYRSKTGRKGWNYRFDYIFVDGRLRDRIASADILYEHFYSDHYPIELALSSRLSLLER
ncbi:MAG: exodeoxyribonuclease III [Firmicutes bacterium]|nr:exodeoxyribonuclease III [Bacillota bacterium]